MLNPSLLNRLSAGPADALRLPAGKLAVGSAADLVLFDSSTARTWPRPVRAPGKVGVLFAIAYFCTVSVFLTVSAFPFSSLYASP